MDDAPTTAPPPASAAPAPAATRELRCRSCGASLEAERLDRSLSVITCSHCGTLHELPREPAAAGAARRARPERVPEPLPERFEVARPPGGLRVVWPAGRKSGAIMVTLFGAIWGGITLAGGLWFLTPLSLVFVYMGAVKAVNRRELRVDGDAIAVRQGPLPVMGGSKRVPRSAVRQLFVTEHVSRTREGQDGRERVRERRHYRLSALLEGERRVRLLGGLGSPGQGLWLEQEIERTLGIRDRAVGGEHGR